jgi:hypothetical protein
VCGEWCKLHWLLLDTPSFDWNTRRSRGHKILISHQGYNEKFLKKVQSFSDTLYIIEEIVRQVGYLPELYENARSEKYWTIMLVLPCMCALFFTFSSYWMICLSVCHVLNNWNIQFSSTMPWSTVLRVSCLSVHTHHDSFFWHYVTYAFEMTTLHNQRHEQQTTGSNKIFVFTV